MASCGSCGEGQACGSSAPNVCGCATCGTNGSCDTTSARCTCNAGFLGDGLSCGAADRCAGRTPDEFDVGCYIFPALGFNDQLSVFAVDAQTVWATGWQSISRWDGTRWHFESAEGGDGIWASSATDAWVVSDATVRRRAGGQWVDVTPQANTPFSGVWGSGPNDVWVVGGYAPGRAWHWTGSSWANPVTLTTTGTMRDVWGTGPNDVWASGSACTLMHFDGTSWTSRAPPACGTNSTSVPEELSDLTGVSANDVWVLSNFLAYHWSGGAWTSADPSPGTEQLRELVAVDATHVYGVGSHLFEWDGSSWSRGPLPGSITQLRSVSALPDGTLWAVGSSGRIAVRSGGTWAERFKPLTNPRLSGSGPGHVLLASNEGVLRWNGTDWVDASVGLPALVSIQAIHAQSPSRAWAVVNTLSAREIFRWNGLGWTSTGAVPGAAAIWAADDTHVWAVGSSGSGSMISFFDGTGWQSVANPATTALTSVFGSSANDVWAVSSNSVLRWNGTQWSAVTVPSLSDPSEVTASGPTNVLVLARYRYHRFSGQAWTASAFTTSNYSRLFAASPSITLGARLGAGNNGILMRVNGTNETMVASSSTLMRSIWGSPWGDAWGAASNQLVTNRP